MQQAWCALGLACSCYQVSISTRSQCQPYMTMSPSMSTLQSCYLIEEKWEPRRQRSLVCTANKFLQGRPPVLWHGCRPAARGRTGACLEPGKSQELCAGSQPRMPRLHRQHCTNLPTPPPKVVSLLTPSANSVSRHRHILRFAPTAAAHTLHSRTLGDSKICGTKIEAGAGGIQRAGAMT